ncbi:uncharacterized protein LOC144577917 [Callithrix jacchus]
MVYNARIGWHGYGFVGPMGNLHSPWRSQWFKPTDAKVIWALCALQGFAHGHRVRVLAMHRAQTRIRILVVARTAFGQPTGLVHPHVGAGLRPRFPRGTAGAKSPIWCHLRLDGLQVGVEPEPDVKAGAELRPDPFLLQQQLAIRAAVGLRGLHPHHHLLLAPPHPPLALQQLLLLNPLLLKPQQVVAAPGQLLQRHHLRLAVYWGRRRRHRHLFWLLSRAGPVELDPCPHQVSVLHVIDSVAPHAVQVHLGLVAVDLAVQLVEPLHLLADGVVLGEHQMHQRLHALHRRALVGPRRRRAGRGSGRRSGRTGRRWLLLAPPVELGQLAESLAHHSPLFFLGHGQAATPRCALARSAHSPALRPRRPRGARCASCWGGCVQSRATSPRCSNTAGARTACPAAAPRRRPRRPRPGVQAVPPGQAGLQPTPAAGFAAVSVAAGSRPPKALAQRPSKWCGGRGRTPASLPGRSTPISSSPKDPWRDQGAGGRSGRALLGRQGQQEQPSSSGMGEDPVPPYGAALALFPRCHRRQAGKRLRLWRWLQLGSARTTGAAGSTFPGPAPAALALPKVPGTSEFCSSPHGSTPSHPQCPELWLGVQEAQGPGPPLPASPRRCAGSAPRSCCRHPESWPFSPSRCSAARLRKGRLKGPSTKGSGARASTRISCASPLASWLLSLCLYLAGRILTFPFFLAPPEAVPVPSRQRRPGSTLCTEGKPRHSAVSN